MRKTTAIWTVTLLIITAVLTMHGFKYKEVHINQVMERDLELNAKKYVKDNKTIKPKLNSVITITSDEMREIGYKLELRDDCNGYVIVSNSKNGDISYKSFIKCDDYETKNYIEIVEESNE